MLISLILSISEVTFKFMMMMKQNIQKRFIFNSVTAMTHPIFILKIFNCMQHKGIDSLLISLSLQPNAKI